MTLQFKTRHCNDICCVDLTSVYGNKMRKFILLCLQVFVISVLLFKSLSSLQFRISRFKRQRLLFGRHILIIFHIIFGVPLRFFRIIFMFNDVVEQLLMIPGTFFKCGFTLAKVTFLFVSSDVTVNVDLINYPFYFATIC